MWWTKWRTTFRWMPKGMASKPLPRQAAWQYSLHRNYRPLGACRLGSYFTGYDARLYARRDLPVDFTPPEGVRCQAVPHVP